MRDLDIIESTTNVKSFIHNLGIDIIGIANLNELKGIPVGLNINCSQLFQQYPYAIIVGAQYGKISKKASGDETAIYLEKIAYDIMEYLEERHYQYLVIHPEDEFDSENRMGLLSLKILAKQAGLGWQGRSLLIISPKYGPIHRLIAILTNMKLNPDEPIKNLCRDCRVCIDKCPKNSLKLCQFDDHPNSREEVLDIKTCLGDNGCMICILKCPYLRN
ncbi:MAG: hypothetical protein Q8N03_02980 [Ignavibacteria bacterium]|nr:hypothetical protein [Ignavibacteria bacterium]